MSTSDITPDNDAGQEREGDRDGLVCAENAEDEECRAEHFARGDSHHTIMTFCLHIYIVCLSLFY